MNRRKLKGKGGHIVSTQTFHAGEFSVRALTGDEDAARGFITGLIASPEHLKQMFQITDKEAAAPPPVLDGVGKTESMAWSLLRVPTPYRGPPGFH